MSRDIDSRVLEMTFDNKNFEKNVSASLNTLDKLKKALNLERSAKSFDDIDKAASKLNFDKLINAATVLEKRFSIFGEIGAAAIHRVTNSMIDLSSKTIGFLTSGVIQGGLKRAMNLEQANFQLQGLLKDADAVAAVMADVSWSVDGTAYGLDAAAKAASMFAATGMRAGDQMKSALRGVAGVAAMTNSEYEDISRIFTTVAGQGKVMADQYNQLASRGLNAAATIADYLTKVGDGAVVTEAQVREMTSDGKISFETFAAAMDDAFGAHAKAANKTFNGAMSNIKAALARIGADFISPIIVQEGPLVNLLNRIREKVNEVRKSTTPFAKEMTSSFNELLTRVAKYVELIDLSTTSTPVKIVRTNWQSVANIFTALKETLLAIGAGFRDVFPESAGATLLTISQKIQALTARLIPNTESFGKLRDIFGGLCALIDIGINLVTTLINRFKPLNDVLRKGVSNIFSLASSFGVWLKDLNIYIKQNDIFNKAIDKTISLFIKVKDRITEAKDRVAAFIERYRELLHLPTLTELISSVKNFISAIKEKFKTEGFAAFDTLLEAIKSKIQSAKDILQRLKDNISEVFFGITKKLQKIDFESLISKMFSGGENFLIGVIKAISLAIVDISKAIGSLDVTSLYKLLSPFAVGGLGVGIKKTLESITKPFQTFTNSASGLLSNTSSILTSIKNVFDVTGKSLQVWQENLKADILGKIALSIGALAIALLIVSRIDDDKLGSSLGAITMLFIDLMTAFAATSKISGNINKAAKPISMMLGISVALIILSAALKKISNIDSDKLSQGLLGVTVLMAETVGALKLLGDNKKLAKGALNVVLLAAAIKILASVVKDLSTLDWEELAKGLFGVGILLGEIDIFLNTVKMNGRGIGTAIGIVILAAALKILASVCKDFAKLNWEEIVKGLVAIGVLLGEVTAFVNLTGNAKHVISTGLALIEIAAAMEILTDVMNKISNLNWEQIAKGLVAIGAALMEIALTTKLMPKNMIGIGTGLVIIAASLEIITHVLGKIGQMQWEDLAKGLTTIGIALMEFVIGLNAMKGTLGASVALTIAAIAILLLTPALTALSKLSFKQLAVGLIAIAGAFAVIGIAGYVLQPVAGTIMLISGAIALFAVSISLLSMALVAFATSGAIGIFIATIQDGLLDFSGILSVDIIKNITSVFMGALTQIINDLGMVVDALCTFIIEQSPNIVRAALTLLSEFVKQLVEGAPDMTRTLLESALELLPILNEYTSPVVDQLITFIISVIRAVTDRIPELVTVIVDFFGVFINAILGALGGYDVNNLIETIEFIGLLALVLEALSLLSGLIPGAMLGVLGLAGIVAEMGLLVIAFGGLAQIPGAQWLIQEGGNFLQLIGEAIGRFVGGLAGGVVEGVSNSLPVLGQNLTDFMTNAQGFIEGASKIDDSVTSGAMSLVALIAAITGAEILSGIAAWFGVGQSVVEFAEQLIPFGSAMVEYSDIVSGHIDGDAITASANAGLALAKLQTLLPSTGGTWQDWFGEKISLDVFGNAIKVFGAAMVEYSDVITQGNGVDSSAIESSAIAAKALVELQNNLPRTGGKLQDWIGEKMDLSTFGENLNTFGEKLVSYSKTITKDGGIDTQAIEDSANAAQLLSDLQNSLPVVDGKIQDWFGQKMSISSFGIKLEQFGESLVNYCNILQANGGIKPELIEGSAKAAEYLVDLQNTLPTESGWWQNTFGGGAMDMGKWGERLDAFGNALVHYSALLNLTPGVNTDLIKASVDSALLLVGLQENLDGTGYDTETLATFGARIKQFGYDFIDTADSLTKTDHNSLLNAITDVRNLITVASSMSTVNLEAVSGFGKGLKEFADFGIDEFVKKFDDSHSKVATAVLDFLSAASSSVETNQNGLATALNTAIDSALTNVNYKGEDFRVAAGNLMTRFAIGFDDKKGVMNDKIEQILDQCLATIKNSYFSSYQSSGSNLWKEVIAGVESQKTPYSDKVIAILDVGLKAVDNKRMPYKTAAENLFIAFFSAIENMKNKVKSTVTTVIDLMLRSINDKGSKFKDAGGALFTSLASGIGSRENHVKTTGSNLINTLYNHLHAYGDKNREFYKIGEYYVTGIANGMDDRAWYVNKRATVLAEGIDKAVRNTLEVRSPSRVAYKTGSFYGQGFINAIIDSVSKAYKAAKEMATGAKNGLNDAISAVITSVNNDLNLTPVIVPEVDPSNALATAAQINSLFNEGRSFTIASQIRSSREYENQNGKSETASISAANNYQFVQNNYSPKALSRIEIYRQTKNQFSTFKEATANK